MIFSVTFDDDHSVNQVQQVVHQQHCLSCVVFEQLQGTGAVQQVGQQGRSEVKAKDVDLLCLRSNQEVDAPVEHASLHTDFNDVFGHRVQQMAVGLRSHFLQDGNVKPLGHTAIFLLFEHLQDPFYN